MILAKTTVTFADKRNANPSISLSLAVKVVCAFFLLFFSCPREVFAQTSTQTITNLTEDSLVQALQQGGDIGFSVDGTIFVTNTITISSNAVLDGSGHKITISGVAMGPLFNVPAGFNFGLTNLTFANTTNIGAPPTIFAPVTLDAIGGAIANEGNLFVNNCIFSNNVAYGGPSFWPELSSGSPGQGGAIYSSGFLAISNSVFAGNSAIGGTDNGANTGRVTSGGSAAGGAIFNAGGTLRLSAVIFSNNAAIGAPPAPDNANTYPSTGGSAAGGAIFSSGGNISAWNITAAGNKAVGQGAQATFGSPPEVLYDGDAGGAYAGALYFGGGNVTISNSIILNNSATGGSSGNGAGGEGQGGGVLNLGITLLSQCNIAGNTAQGGGIDGSFEAFGNSAQGSGGGVYNAGNIQIIGALLSSNTAVGGAGTSIPAMGFGGAIYNSGKIVVENTTLANNAVVGYPGGAGGAIANIGSVQLETTVLSSNAATGGTDAGDAIYNAGTFTTDSSSVIQPNVAGTPPFTYDWQIDGINIEDATLPTFNLTNFSFGIARAGSLIIGSSTNSAPHIEILNLVNAYGTNPPQFLVEPTSQSAVFGGNSAEFSAMAVSSSSLTYQWQLNGTNVSGATDSDLVLNYPQFNQHGTYTVIASNMYGATTSQSAALTFRSVGLRVAQYSDGTLGILTTDNSQLTFVVESSTNLVQWNPISTIRAPFSFVPDTSTTPNQFFRTVAVP